MMEDGWRMDDGWRMEDGWMDGDRAMREGMRETMDPMQTKWAVGQGRTNAAPSCTYMCTYSYMYTYT
jgi:hypothetical protein